jgi:hypothetical protein
MLKISFSVVGTTIIVSTFFNIITGINPFRFLTIVRGFKELKHVIIIAIEEWAFQLDVIQLAHMSARCDPSRR